MLGACSDTGPSTAAAGTPRRPWRVLVVGDSVADQIGVAYSGIFDGTGLVDVRNDAKPGTSRFGDDTIDHLDRTWAAAVTDDDPAVVIVQTAFAHSRFACPGTITEHQTCTDTAEAAENERTA